MMTGGLYLTQIIEKFYYEPVYILFIDYLVCIKSHHFNVNYIFIYANKNNKEDSVAYGPHGPLVGMLRPRERGPFEFLKYFGSR